MRQQRTLSILAAAAVATLVTACASSGAGTAGNPMSFFITSANPGKGADLGGLAGADAYCQKLATAAGAGGKNWRAYLSTSAQGGQPAVNARDRIGKGPWVNAKGVTIASNVAELHSGNKLTKETNLNEKGQVVNGAGDTPNMHDILTGSNADGTLATGSGDTTCKNWTSSTDGSAIVGHHDGRGTNPDPIKNRSWNSSHGTQGCSPDGLKSTGSAGLFYCFAAN
jgi:hypothetical protein